MTNKNIKKRKEKITRKSSCPSHGMIGCGNLQPLDCSTCAKIIRAENKYRESNPSHPLQDKQECFACHGTGERVNEMYEMVVCGFCNGKGKTPPSPLQECECNCHKRMQTCDSLTRNYLHQFCCKDYQIHFNGQPPSSVQEKDIENMVKFGAGCPANPPQPPSPLQEWEKRIQKILDKRVQATNGPYIKIMPLLNEELLSLLLKQKEEYRKQILNKTKLWDCHKDIVEVLKILK